MKVKFFENWEHIQIGTDKNKLERDYKNEINNFKNVILKFSGIEVGLAH